MSFIILGLLVLFLASMILSVNNIGPREYGLVIRRFGGSLENNVVAFEHEAGYQADLLMPGQFRFAWWFSYKVIKLPWPSVPANQIGIVIAQVGKALPPGAKSGVYRKAFGLFTDIRAFVQNGGEIGVQRPTLPPGFVGPVHPVGFLVLTKDRVYGIPVGDYAQHGRQLTVSDFGLDPSLFDVKRIEPAKDDATGRTIDRIGVVTTLDGPPLESGSIACRLGGPTGPFGDIAETEQKSHDDTLLIEAVLGSKNSLHNSYQDFQAFIDAGGRIGLQHDPLLYGAYNLNPFLVSVEMVPMLVVKQGEVAVVKAYVGLATEDTSGEDFKFGSLVRPGHRGIWEEPLRTGKYAINPRCYSAEIVPTFILTLNWADANSTAHSYDKDLRQIVAKSREGFVFALDLQVQIHVPDTEAPKVISTVGTMTNLVNEVLQAAVGNHFRDKLQAMPAIDFIEKRGEVQAEAQAHIGDKLKEYRVETRGVY